MAGKFINTSTAYSQMVSQVPQTMKGLLDNPYYLYTDKKASECTYYNLNTTMTTLDEATRGNYSELSAASPLRFNKIKGFYLYGVTKIDVNLDINDFGLESSDITGEAIVLPKTIVPYPGDYFKLTQISEDHLFRVTAVNPNTLETGATMYRINYTMVGEAQKDVEPQVVKVFNFVLDTSGNGTNLDTNLIEEDTYNDAVAMQDCATELKDYYMSLFYDPKVQSFTYAYHPTEEYYELNGQPKHLHIANFHRVDCTPFGFKVYDPYLIEFIIRNKILSGASTYLYISQQMYLPATFAMDYNKSIFASMEDKHLDKHYGRSVGNLLYCDQQLSILYQYPEDYFYMEYKNLNAKFHYISIFDDPDFKNKVANNSPTMHPLKSIIIKYFNDVAITLEDLEKLRHIDYMSTKEFFYMIPMVIFCIEQQLVSNLSSKSST